MKCKSAGFNWSLFDRLGWAKVDKDDGLLEWIGHAREVAREKLYLNQFDQNQLRSGKTWFVGVNFPKKNWLF